MHNLSCCRYLENFCQQTLKRTKLLCERCRTVCVCVCVPTERESRQERGFVSNFDASLYFTVRQRMQSMKIYPENILVSRNNIWCQDSQEKRGKKQQGEINQPLHIHTPRMDDEIVGERFIGRRCWDKQPRWRNPLRGSTRIAFQTLSFNISPHVIQIEPSHIQYHSPILISGLEMRQSMIQSVSFLFPKVPSSHAPRLLNPALAPSLTWKPTNFVFISQPIDNSHLQTHTHTHACFLCDLNVGLYQTRYETSSISIAACLGLVSPESYAGQVCWGGNSKIQTKKETFQIHSALVGIAESRFSGQVHVDVTCVKWWHQPQSQHINLLISWRASRNHPSFLISLLTKILRLAGTRLEI